MSPPQREDPEIGYALICLRTGSIVRQLGVRECPSIMADFASAAPELLAAGGAVDLGALFTQLGSERHGHDFEEVALVAGSDAYVVQRLRKHGDMALVAVSPVGTLGLMLAGVRAYMLELEAQP